MMVKLPAPRLLPVTITTLSVLLAVKCGVLVQAAVTDGRRTDSVMVAPANAAAAEADHAKPAATRSPPLSPPPAEPSKGEPAQVSPPRQGMPAQAARPQQSEAPPVSASEKTILQNLRQRRKELDARETSVAARESVLAASEQKLTVRVSELQALQKKLEGLDSAQKEKEDAGWQAMVKLYEAMKPKEAATIFNELSMPVLLQVMDRMKDAKAAAVMAAMNPDRARDVTSELAQLRTGQDISSNQAEPGLKSSPSGG
ncbi:MotE family protein [Rhodopila sp.]|uniref:MotE family protein n=1 Tax=Rhodopila sp. TaxID=2480087 RepID=UPI003D1148FB